MGNMPRMVPAYTYHVKAYKYYLVVKKKKNPNQRPCVRKLLICSLAFLIWKELQKMCHPCYFIEAQTEHRGEVICHMLVAKVGLEHRSADPQATGLCTALSLNPPQQLSLPVSPYSLAELEKEVGNLRRGLRAVELVSTSSPPAWL